MSEPPGQGERPDEDGRPDEPSDDAVGSVAEEAALLFGAVADWAREHGSDLGDGLGEGVSGLADRASRAARNVDEHLATGSAECTWCPVCRTLHAVRQTSPEVRAHLATAASALLQAAAGVLATAVPDRGSGTGRGSGVERIDLDEADRSPEGDDDTWPEEDE